MLILEKRVSALIALARLINHDVCLKCLGPMWTSALRIFERGKKWINWIKIIYVH
jgi:hypothetical protein